MNFLTKKITCVDQVKIFGNVIGYFQKYETEMNVGKLLIFSVDSKGVPSSARLL